MPNPYNEDFLPIIGPWYARVGQVISIVSMPCTPDPMIFVQAFGMTAPKLIATLLKPDPVEIISERYKAPHRRRRKAHAKNASVILPDTDALIAKLLGIDGKYRLPVWAFRIYAPLQIAGFFFLVANSTTQFLLDWVSMAYKQSSCLEITPQWWRASHNGFLIGQWNDWAVFDPVGLDVTGPMVGGPGMFFVTEGQILSITIKMPQLRRVPATPHGPLKLDFQVIDLETGVTLDLITGWENFDDTLIPSPWAKIDIAPPLTGVRYMQLQAYSHGTALQMYGFEMQVQQGSYEDYGLTYDP